MRIVPKKYISERELISLLRDPVAGYRLKIKIVAAIHSGKTKIV